MPPKRPDTEQAVRAVLHEIRSRVGAVRLAVTTLLDGNVDAELRAALLATADRETLRISTEMAAVSALVQALSDRASERPIDVGAALRSAAVLARRTGTQVHVRSSGKPVVRGRARAVEAGLLGLINLVADVDGAVAASASREGGSALVRIRRADGAAVNAETALVRNLVAAMGANPVPLDAGVGLRIAGGSR